MPNNIPPIFLMPLSTLNFERVHNFPIRAFYEYVGYRAPKAGEWYVSGAIPQGYRAPNDLSAEYHIVRPTFKAVLKSVHVKGEPFKQGEGL